MIAHDRRDDEHNRAGGGRIIAGRPQRNAIVTAITNDENAYARVEAGDQRERYYPSLEPLPGDHAPGDAARS